MTEGINEDQHTQLVCATQVFVQRHFQLINTQVILNEFTCVSRDSFKCLINVGM